MSARAAEYIARRPASDDARSTNDQWEQSLLYSLVIKGLLLAGTGSLRELVNRVRGKTFRTVKLRMPRLIKSEGTVWTARDRLSKVVRLVQTRKLAPNLEGRLMPGRRRGASEKSPVFWAACHPPPPPARSLPRFLFLFLTAPRRYQTHRDKGPPCKIERAS